MSRYLAIEGNAVVPDVPSDDCGQVGPHLGDAPVHAPPQGDFHLSKLRMKTLPHRLPTNGELPFAGSPTDVGEAKEVEGLGLSETLPTAIFSRIAAELDEARLVGVECQPEPCESFAQIGEVLRPVAWIREPHDEVVRPTHDDDFTASRPSPPLLGPQVEHVVKVEIGQEWADTPTLNRSCLAPNSLPFFPHTRFEPFADQADEAWVCDPVLQELDHPFVIKRIEEAPDVCVKHRSHRPRRQSDRPGIQRLVLVPSRPKSIRESEKILLVDCAQNLDNRTLDDLVFQRGNPQRALPTVGLGDLNPPNRFRSISPTPFILDLCP